MKRSTLAFCLTTLPLVATAADDIEHIDNLNQTQFRQITEDLGAALSYKAIAPAEALGVTGFDLGFETSATRVENSAAWEVATGDSVSTLYVSRLHLHKGLPLGIDVGAFIGQVPGSNVSFAGAELRYAIIKGGIATPAVGARATYTKLSGVNQLDFSTTGVELTVSKGFAVFTPYAGIGEVWASADPQNVANVTSEDVSLTKYYVGTNINVAVINVAIEADRTGDATSYSAKFGWRF
ncbi:MAG: hypothetical protein HY308_08415 [Gammaproteobacteria bacterium]|nr:hypothetical protein [Gammaproteobacteria bacterium]